DYYCSSWASSLNWVF
nr:immunoglobulin light chain junction region [Macaca mulatta]